MGLPPLRGGWFGHPSEQYCFGDDVLACSVEDQGSLTAIIDDALVDIASPTLSGPIVAPVPELLLKGHVLLF